MKYTHWHLGNCVRASTETTMRRKKTARKSFYEYVKTFILQSIWKQSLCIKPKHSNDERVERRKWNGIIRCCSVCCLPGYPRARVCVCSMFCSVGFIFDEQNSKWIRVTSENKEKKMEEQEDMAENRSQDEPLHIDVACTHPPSSSHSRSLSACFEFHSPLHVGVAANSENETRETEKRRRNEKLLCFFFFVRARACMLSMY